jgi:hypothetical protein
MYGYQNNEQSVYYQAQRIVRAKLGFYRHLTSYVFVNAMLFVIWLVTQSPDVNLGGLHIHNRNDPWFLVVLLFWGIGLVAHYLSVFAFPGRNSQQMIEAEMRRLGATPPASNYYPAPEQYQK